MESIFDLAHPYQTYFKMTLPRCWAWHWRWSCWPQTAIS